MSARASRQPAPAGKLPASKIRLIKTALRQIGMEDADYRALLQRVASVASSVDLPPEGFEAVMAELHRLGFQYAPSGRKPKAAGAGSAPGRPTAAQWRLLEERARLVGYSGLEDPRFIAWLRPRGKVEHPRFLDMYGMQSALGGLGNWIQRNIKKS
jgi:hypothetical protein